MHGLRDAQKFSDLASLTPGATGLVASSPLAMRFGTIETGARGFELKGSWPDGHEAEARLSKLGRADAHACALSAGYTSGWLSGAFDTDILALETSCAASGSDACRFQAREIAAWQAEGEDAEWLRNLSIRDLRALVERGAEPGPIVPLDAVPELPSNLAGDDPAVHVWGPVIVMPFTDVDTALATVEMLGRDPSMRSVRVVVLDLGGAILDEAFGAAGLEQLIEDVEAWGADIILTGISPFSEDVVAGLETSHLLIRKDLPQAIAYAFQIAEAHRHLL
jgi:anti-anti-sigma regulatory factor